MPKLLVIMPVYEEATYIWSACLRALLEKGVIPVPEPYVLKLLIANHALPDSVYNALQEPDVVGVAGLGAAHGNTCIIVTQHSQLLFSCGNSKNALLKGKFWNQVSCLVGQGLVPEFVEKWGVPVALGEVTEYWFVSYLGSQGWENDPCASFIKANWEFDYNLLLGARAGDAYKAMLDAYTREAQFWVNRDPEVAHWLKYDRDYRKLFGDEGFTLPPGQPPLYKLTILPPQPEDAGTVEPSPGEYSIPHGQEVVIKATPKPGWVVDRWKVDESVVEDTPELKLTMTKDYTVQAFFQSCELPRVYRGKVEGNAWLWWLALPVIGEAIVMRSDDGTLTITIHGKVGRLLQLNIWSYAAPENKGEKQNNG